ncbi:hypothetical protein EAE96_011471 [Botrytis aclada]|nr:hypothetical protein EAE96_011471 [Botrytis aclada]
MFAVIRFMEQAEERQVQLQAEYNKRQEEKEIQEAKMRAEEDQIMMAKAEETSTGISCPIETYGDWRMRPFWLNVPDVQPSEYMDMRFLTEDQMWAVKARDNVVMIKRLMELKCAMRDWECVSGGARLRNVRERIVGLLFMHSLKGAQIHNREL